MKIGIYTLFFLLLLLSSCDEAIEYDKFNNNPEQLVLIYSSISPQDEFLKVQVSRTLSSVNAISENDFESFIISNAVVVLSNTSNEKVTLTYMPEDLNYQIEANQLPVFPSETYYLSVTVNGKEFTSTCKIPSNTIDEIDYQLSENLNDEGNLKESITISFQDILRESNYYIIGGRLENYIISSSLDYEDKRFATDQIEDGIYISSFGFFTVNDTETVTDIALQVANVDPILYNNLYAIYFNKKNLENPFYEIIIAPNNIIGSGGYGVFGGFQIKEKIISYK